MRLPFLAVLTITVCANGFAQSGAHMQCQTVVDAAARLACYDAAFPPKPAGPSGVVAATFGFPQKAAALEVQAIESMVNSDFDGWGPNDKIRLQNGQVWEVVDGSSGTTTSAMRKVTVKRGALGSYFLEFDGLTKSPRVRRIK